MSKPYVIKLDNGEKIFRVADDHYIDQTDSLRIIINDEPTLIIAKNKWVYIDFDERNHEIP